MRSFFNIILLFLFSLFPICFIDITPAFILAFTLCISLVCSCSFIFGRCRLILLLLYAAAIFPIPELLLFLPPVTYWLAESRRYIPAAAICAAGLFFHSSSGYPLLIYILLGCLIAVWLCRQNLDHTYLYRQYKHIRDDSREANLLLTQKNQTLREKQDYEIYAATLKERNRIAREIHDNVGHLLTRSILITGALKITNTEEKLDPSLNQLEETLSAAMDNIRTSVHDLHDESVNLEEAVKSLILDFSFCPVTLDYDMEHAVPREVKYGFLAILKEALSNITRHSDASAVHIVIREHPALYQLLIEDNGTRTGVIHESGIGLANMRERIQSLKGNIQFTNEKGFRIFITVPRLQKGSDYV